MRKTEWSIVSDDDKIDYKLGNLMYDFATLKAAKQAFFNMDNKECYIICTKNYNGSNPDIYYMKEIYQLKWNGTKWIKELTVIED